MKIRVRVESGYTSTLLDVALEELDESVGLKLREKILEILAESATQKESNKRAYMDIAHTERGRCDEIL